MTVIQNFSLIDKTHEDLMNDALYQIPLMCREWTNFNPSDPGITLLENLSATNILQQAAMDEVDEGVRKKLLALLGIHQGSIVPAKVCMSFKQEGDELFLPSHTSFRCGEVIYETDFECRIQNLSIQKIYSQLEGERKNLPNISKESINVSASPFGKSPLPGNSLYLVFDKMPHPNRPLNLYVVVEDSHIKRNPCGEDTQLNFAALTWQYYTKEGWTAVEALDETKGFLYSGLISLKLPQLEGEAFQEEGFCIRCVLAEAAYDVPPKLRSIYTNIFHATQQQTFAAGIEFPGGLREYSLVSRLLEDEGRFQVYVKEGSGPFRQYVQGDGKQDRNRIFQLKERRDNFLSITFPESCNPWMNHPETVVKIVLYSPELLGKDVLGEIYAYDNQIVETDREDIVADHLELFVCQPDEEGVPFFTPAKPGVPTEEGFLYHVHRDGRLEILSPAIGGDGWLLWSNLVQSQGARGNIREGSSFIREGGSPTDAVFFNPQRGENGRSAESIEEMRHRFVEDFGRSATAVTKADYEVLVRGTPGLAIRKVNIGVNYGNNLVKITVMPYSTDRFPEISQEYRRSILSHIDQYRLMTTSVVLEQPKYVAVDVFGAVNLKAHFDNGQEMIRQLLEKELDFIHSHRGFGGTIVFGELYNKIEQLPCVEYIYNLSIRLGGYENRVSTGEDIQLEYNELCYLGNLGVETIHSNFTNKF